MNRTARKKRATKETTVDLALGLDGRGRYRVSTTLPFLDHMLELFPALKRYYSGLAGLLSGGEQQQLAIARALLSRPRLLLLDEPSLGLAPILVDLLFEALARLRDEGTTIFLVEQVVDRTTTFADRTHVLRNGQIVLTGTRDELAGSSLASAYLGVRG